MLSFRLLFVFMLWLCIGISGVCLFFLFPSFSFVLMLSFPCFRSTNDAFTSPCLSGGSEKVNLCLLSSELHSWIVTLLSLFFLPLSPPDDGQHAKHSSLQILAQPYVPCLAFLFLLLSYPFLCFLCANRARALSLRVFIFRASRPSLLFNAAFGCCVEFLWNSKMVLS